MKFFLGFFLYVLICFGQTCAPADRLQPVDSIKGALSEANCRLSDGTFYKEYLLALPVRGVVQLDLDATNGFDGTILVRNDSGVKTGAGSNIHRMVESGLYHVFINALGAGQTGDFNFRSSFTPEPNVLCSQFSRIGVGQTVSGRLTDASCRLPDHSAFDGYEIRVFGGGTLDVTMQSADFDAYVILRTDDGRLLAFDDNGGGGSNARLTAPVNGNQTYTIIAAASSAEEKPGPYTLSVGFRPDDDETCRSLKTLTPAIPVQGSISENSCQFTLPADQGIALFNYYDLQVANDGAIDLRVANATFEPELTLLDASGNVIVTDQVSGGSRTPALHQQLAPGSYKVLVFDDNTTNGDYTLQLNFQPGLPEVCPVLSLAAGAVMPGTLSGASCRTDAGMGDVYRIELPSSGTLDIAMTSSDFDTLLVLRDEKDSFVNANDNTPGSTNSHLVADVPAGVYTVAAVSNDFPGGYAINFQFTPHDLAACAKIQKLDLNSAYRGFLSDSSCHASDGRPVDYYQFTTPADGTVAVIMTSIDLDSFLTIEDAQGNILRSDDNGFGQGDALIQQFLPAGSYRIGGRAVGDIATGFYRLDLLFAAGNRPAGCTPLSVLAPGDSITGRTGFASCQYPDGTFSDVYQLDVKDAVAVDAGLTSQDFAGFLILWDSKGNVLDENDSGGAGNRATVARTLDPGSYYLIAKPAADPAFVGFYTLEIKTAP